MQRKSILLHPLEYSSRDILSSLSSTLIGSFLPLYTPNRSDGTLLAKHEQKHNFATGTATATAPATSSTATANATPATTEPPYVVFSPFAAIEAVQSTSIRK